MCVVYCGAYIYVVDIKDLGLEHQAQSSGLLDGVSQLTVSLGETERKMNSAYLIAF